MKILTGTLRGRRITFRPSPELRPTSDKARKAIFDMFQGEMEGKRVLDLFSGTGALGLEALSQGAEHVTFVDNDKAQCRDISANLEQIGGLAGRTAVVCADALETLHRLNGRGESFDFVFIDPPYDDGMASKSMESLAASDGLVAKGGFVLVECRKRHDLPEVFGTLKLLRDKRYGQTKILIYRLCG